MRSLPVEMPGRGPLCRGPRSDGSRPAPPRASSRLPAGLGAAAPSADPGWRRPAEPRSARTSPSSRLPARGGQGRAGPGAVAAAAAASSSSSSSPSSSRTRAPRAPSASRRGTPRERAPPARGHPAPGGRRDAAGRSRILPSPPLPSSLWRERGRAPPLPRRSLSRNGALAAREPRGRREFCGRLRDV